MDHELSESILSWAEFDCLNRQEDIKKQLHKLNLSALLTKPLNRQEDIKKQLPNHKLNLSALLTKPLCTAN